MKRILGMGVGIVYFGIAFAALRRATAGWETGFNDIGFWWTVIAVILAIAATGAMVGTWIHTRPSDG
jgi:hypothetical protein